MDYCPYCGQKLNRTNKLLCTSCGRKISSRFLREPIPNKLRHMVFQRDNYRCKECGASKDEPGVSLEIDHIVPVSMGGTNDIDNLQTLCKTCNRKKGANAWVGGERDSYNNIERLNHIKSKINNNKEEALKIANKRQLRIEKERKELYDKIFPKINEYHVLKLREGNSQIANASKNEVVKYLVNNFPQEYLINEILNILDNLKVMKEEYIEKYGNTRFYILYCSDMWFYFYKLPDNVIRRLNANSEIELKKIVYSKNLPWTFFEFKSDNNLIRNFIDKIYSKEGMGNIEELSIFRFHHLKPSEMRKKVLSNLDPIISKGISYNGYHFCECGNKIKYYDRYCEHCKPPDELFEIIMPSKSQPKLINCPNCGKKIKENALRCKFCKTMLKK